MFRDCVFWIGAVENNEDPEKRGRVQVRIFGAHDIYNQHMTDYAGRTQWAARYKNVGGSSSSSGSSSGSGSGTGSESSGTPVTARGTPVTAKDGSTTPKPQTQKGGGLTVAQRNNNPMNWGKGTYSNGQTAKTSGEYRFNDMNDAIRQYQIQINRYQHNWKINGKPASSTCNKTVWDLWNTWAPSSENEHTKRYVKKYCDEHGLKETDALNTDDPETMAEFMATVISTESPTKCSKEDILIAMNGGYAANLTAQSTLLQDGVLYVGASNATTPGASDNTGQAISYDEGKNWKRANQEQYDTSQANAKTTAAKTPITSANDTNNQNKGATTPAGSAGAQAQQTSVIGDGASPTKDVSTAGSPDSTCHTLPTGDLPWAFCLYPCSEYGGTSYGTLPAPQVQNGAWVVGMSLDGAFMNQLVILGIMPSAINIDVLSTNPNQSSTNPLTNITLPNSTPSSSNNSTKVKNMTLAELQDGIWNAESSRSANKKRSSAYCYGAMQLSPALAAEYILRGAASNELAAAGLTLSDDMKASLQSITNSYGKKIIPFLESDSNIAKFCDVLTENDTLNKAIGAAYLEDCASAAGGDPVITALYYMQGDGNAKKILNTYGYTNGLPDTVSYATFAEQATEWMRNHKQSNDFTIYLNNITKDYGGLSALEAARTSAS